MMKVTRTIPPSALNAAIRAIQGESDLDVVRLALVDGRLAWTIALAPEVHPLVRAIVALQYGLTALIDSSTAADPALHTEIERMVKTSAGISVLWTWAEIAPAGWGRALSAVIIDAVQNRKWNPAPSAALIGPCDESAALLHYPIDIAFALRRWGQSTPENPTAWIHDLSTRERDRLIATVQRDEISIAYCLPWLPTDIANQIRINHSNRARAITSFAEASPTARAQHADLVNHLVAQAQPSHLVSLTRLACATQTREAWQRVQTLIQMTPDAAYDVVTAAPWDDLEEAVRAAILGLADQSPICAAVAAARGQQVVGRITNSSAIAFFAALDPMVWDALDDDARFRCRQAMREEHRHFVVRSLGLRPEILAYAPLDTSLLSAAQRHAGDAVDFQWALFPVALRYLPYDVEHVLIAALPTLPPDPGAFFSIVCGISDPAVIASARTALRTLSDLEVAVVLHRCVRRGDSIPVCCTALQNVLRGQSWDNLASMMAIFNDDARAAFIPHLDASVERLTHTDRWEKMRQALVRLASLPPNIAVPTQFALAQATPRNERDAGEAIANALQDYSDVFLMLTEALNDRLCDALLPLPKEAALADALRALARDDPPIAQRLARALRSREWRGAIQSLLATPPHHAVVIWQALDEPRRRAINDVVTVVSQEAASLLIHDLIAGLALAAVRSDDADLRGAGVTALAARPELARTIWNMLPHEVQQSLSEIPGLADLMPVSDRPAEQRRRCW